MPVYLSFVLKNYFYFFLNILISSKTKFLAITNGKVIKKFYQINVYNF